MEKIRVNVHFSSDHSRGVRMGRMKNVSSRSKKAVKRYFFVGFSFIYSFISVSVDYCRVSWYVRVKKMRSMFNDGTLVSLVSTAVVAGDGDEMILLLGFFLFIYFYFIYEGCRIETRFLNSRLKI